MKFDKKLYLYISILCVFISLFMCFVFVCNVGNIRSIDSNDYTKDDLSNKYEYKIKIHEEKGCYVFEGYISEKEININTSSIEIGLYDDSYFCLPTKLVYLNNFSKSNDKYDNNGWCGFEARLNKKRMENSINELRLFFLVSFNDDTKIIKSDIYLKELIENDKYN